jgi:hypothetical protein
MYSYYSSTGKAPPPAPHSRGAQQMNKRQLVAETTHRIESTQRQRLSTKYSTGALARTTLTLEIRRGLDFLLSLSQGNLLLGLSTIRSLSTYLLPFSCKCRRSRFSHRRSPTVIRIFGTSKNCGMDGRSRGTPCNKQNVWLNFCEINHRRSHHLLCSPSTNAIIHVSDPLCFASLLVDHP